MLGEEIDDQGGIYDKKQKTIFFQNHNRTRGGNPASQRCLAAFEQTAARVARKVEAESPDVLSPTMPIRLLDSIVDVEA